MPRNARFGYRSPDAVGAGWFGGTCTTDRTDSLPTGEIATTIITSEEQMRGWLAHAAQAGTPDKILVVYTRLSRHVETFRKITLLPFDEAAIEQYETLRRLRVRVGTQDLKIATTCLARDTTLLTRNLRDFGKVPGLRAEDWSL